MYIGDFEQLVHRNKKFPNVRFIASHWGKRQGAPEGTCTLLVGDWTMTYKYGKPYLSPEHIAAYNVPIPFIPPDHISEEDGTVKVQGWRPLLAEMLADRVILPTKEIMKVLADRNLR